jgi:flagellar protein FliL
MAETTSEAAPPRRNGLKPLLLGGVLAAVAGGGAFFVVHSGLFPPAPSAGGSAPSAMPAPVGTFVRIEPVTINLSSGGAPRHLRFGAQLEVAPAHAAEVARLMPRILDVLNTYLRALDTHELEEPAALLRLRGQILRRIQIVTGPGRVTDILITEFVFT